MHIFIRVGLFKHELSLLFFKRKVVMIAAVCFALAGGLASMAKAGTSASLIVTAYPRYGLDLNGNGVIDIPNTREYVMNTVGPKSCPLRDGRPQFSIRFSPKIFTPSVPCPFDEPILDNGRLKLALPDFPSASIILDGNPGGPRRSDFPANSWPPGTDIVPPIGCRATQEKVLICEGSIVGSPTQVRQRLCEQAMGHADIWGSEPATFNWRIFNDESILIGDFDMPDSNDFDLCLPEGKFIADLSMLRSGSSVAPLGRYSFRVRDYLMVGMGDSYSSGEGNPEISELAAMKCIAANCRVSRSPMLNVIWADDGATPFIRRYVQDGLFETTEEIWAVSSATSEFLDHQSAHRSSRAFSSLTSLAIEEMDTASSVTYLNLAMTGARFDSGMMVPYRGVDGRLLMSQYTELERLTEGRRIDALFITLGGNDAGFGNVLEGLIAREYMGGPIGDNIGPDKDLIWAAARNGKWAALENDVFVLMQSSLTWSDRIGLNGLGIAFKDFALALNKIPIDTVYVSEYPASLEYRSGRNYRYCTSVLDEFVSKKFSIGPLKITRDLEISGSEVTGVAKEVAIPMNEQLRLALQGITSEAQGISAKWKFVSGVYQTSRAHGLCIGSKFKGPYAPLPLNRLLRSESSAEGRWFRRGKEAQEIQGPLNTRIEPSRGTAHPNEYGHKGMACQLLNTLDFADGSLNVRERLSFSQVACP